MSLSKSSSPQEQAYAKITAGLKEFDFTGSSVPCFLILSGDHAFPLAVSSSGHVLAAASLYGSGRIVVFTHETYLTSLPDLVKNALLWLKGDKSDNMSVGINRNVKKVADHLSNTHFQAKVMDDFSRGQGVGVFVTDAYSVGADEKKLGEFLKAGGGVLMAGQAWHWSYKHPEDNVLLQFEGNKVSGLAGIHFYYNYGERECLPVTPTIPCSWKAIDISQSFTEDLKILMKGVSELDIRGSSIPCEVLAHGALSFPIGTTEDGRAFLAGGYYGKGRVVVFTHENFLAEESLTGFLDNALHWLDQGRQGVVGVEPDWALNTLKKSGLTCEITDFKPGLSVFVCTVYNKHIQEIQDFVAQGGGLLIGGQVWNWASQRPDTNYLTEWPGNKMLNPMGLSMLSGYTDRLVYKAPDPASINHLHFRHLLYLLAAHVFENKELTADQEKYLKSLGKACAGFLRLKNFNCYSYMNIVYTLTDIFKKIGLPQLSGSSPTKSPKDHFLVHVATELYKVCPSPEELLPYFIKDIPQLLTVSNQKINISVNTGEEEEWVSTGLYLSPGMKTYINTSSEIVNKGWKVQISCQTDILDHKEFYRAPSVSVRFPVTLEKMLVHNLWGGLIYLIAPPNTQVTGVEVVVEVAVSAPWYRSGVTSLTDWALLRSAPSPWAELEFENIILTVPSDVVRSLERPHELAAHWDTIMRAIADLAVIPHKFKRKERIVADVQISAGWMHAGYPVMVHTASATELVTVDKGCIIWGPIHELGHNQQRWYCEFRPHTKEATCNLWSVYVHETVLGVPREKAHASLTPECRNTCAEKYPAEGRKLCDWNTWVALETYLQLQEKFGWDAFKKVFAAYHSMNENDVPSDNEGKMNLYAVTFSQIVDMDLTRFLKSWGWPITSDTEAKLSKLSAWTDHPMAKYK